jgi:hypothetical protein
MALEAQLELEAYDVVLIHLLTPLIGLPSPAGLNAWLRWTFMDFTSSRSTEQAGQVVYAQVYTEPIIAYVNTISAYEAITLAMLQGQQVAQLGFGKG